MGLVRTDASCVRPMGYSAIFFCVFSSVLLASLRLCPSEVRKWSGLKTKFAAFFFARILAVNCCHINLRRFYFETGSLVGFVPDFFLARQ